MKHLGRCLVGACWLAAWPASALASGSAVDLELHDCDALSENALREHLALELSTLGLSQAEARLVLRCEPSVVGIELFQSTGTRYADGYYRAVLDFEKTGTLPGRYGAALRLTDRPKR